MDERPRESDFCHEFAPSNTNAAGEDRLSRITIGCAFRVMNTLGIGFSEKVYENALAVALRGAGVKVSQQQGVKVWFDDVVVGDYATDLLIEDMIVVELKVARALNNAHIGQCLNYLKATRLHLCLLLNFGTPRVEIRRILNGH